MSNPTPHGFRFTARNSDDRPVDKWWCCECQQLIQSPVNPVLCVDCGGDMTIAPKSQR